jgi:hypothetical protein
MIEIEIAKKCFFRCFKFFCFYILILDQISCCDERKFSAERERESAFMRFYKTNEQMWGSKNRIKGFG